MAAADQAILDQIQKLSGVLRQARDTDPTRSQSGSSSNHGPYQYSYRGRGRYQYPKFAPSRPLTTSKNVEIGGEVFKASSNKLTRQVTPAGSSTPVASSASAPVQPTSQSRAQRFASRGTYRSNQNRTRGYKPRGRRHHNMSLILNKAQPKKEKVEKQCPFFSRTGTCNRGKSCRYQHDSEKVAICPRFLSGDCPSTAETCLLSHSATLNRVSPCVHFQNNGRCKNGDQCVYPHVRVGNKASVCRDFAVLGYCEKGIDCNEAHLRECPDFAETGSCKNPKCKLPHVIRANRRKVLTTGNNPPGKPDEQPSAVKIEPVAPSSHDENTDSPQHQPNDVEYTFEGGDEFIPLTFVESEEEGDEVASEADEDEDEEEGDEEEEEAETEMKVFA